MVLFAGILIVWMIIVIIVIVLYIGYNIRAGFKDKQENYKLEEYSNYIETIARIKEINRKVDYDITFDYWTVRYTAFYEFDVNGKTYYGKGKVTSLSYFSKKVDILYNPHYKVFFL